jgi:integrase
MNTTFKPHLLHRRKKDDGRTPVYIRITQNRRYSLLSSGIAIQAQYWRNKPKYGSWIKGGKTGHPSADAYNNKIKRIVEKLERMALNNEDLTRKQLVKRYRGTDNGEFQAHATRYAKRLADDGKYSSQSQIKAAASKFEDFSSTDLRFNEITPKMLNDFQDWMEDELDNHPNTIRKTMNRIKPIHNDAYKKDLASNLPFQDPKFEKVSSVETKKTALSIEQIHNIEAVDLETDSWQWHVRNFFLFSFWAGGIRFTDLALLRWENIRDGRLKYTMGKNGKDKDVLLLPQATRILEYYRSALGRYEGMRDDLPPETIATMKNKEFIFPIVDSEYRNAKLLEQKRKAATGNTLTNRALKKIAKQAGISTNVTFHISRHSFARWADNSNVMDRKDIQRMLAHSKMETTERYLSSISEYNVDEKMQKLANQYNDHE